jgi:hypothetical protein
MHLTVANYRELKNFDIVTPKGNDMQIVLLGLKLLEISGDRGHFGQNKNSSFENFQMMTKAKWLDRP